MLPRDVVDELRTWALVRDVPRTDDTPELCVSLNAEGGELVDLEEFPALERAVNLAVLTVGLKATKENPRAVLGVGFRALRHERDEVNGGSLSAALREATFDGRPIPEVSDLRDDPEGAPRVEWVSPDRHTLLTFTVGRRILVKRINKYGEWVESPERPETVTSLDDAPGRIIVEHDSSRHARGIPTAEEPFWPLGIELALPSADAP